MSLRYTIKGIHLQIIVIVVPRWNDSNFTTDSIRVT